MNKPKVEVLSLMDAVIPDANNINRHTQRGAALVNNSLRRRGAFRGIAAAGKGAKTPVIYAGNLTLEQAVDAGITEAIVVHTTGNQIVVTVRDDIAPGSPEAIALGLEDNESAARSYSPDLDILAALAAGDDALLAALRREDKVFGGMLEGMGVRDEPQFSRADELQKKWQTATGQVWGIGDHRLAVGDCTDRAVVDAVMMGEKAELLWTDPPYHVGKDFGEYDEGDVWDSEFQKAWLDSAFRILNSDAQRYICFAQARSRDAILCYAPKRLLVWCKPFALMRANEWDWAYEFTAWCYDTDRPTYFEKPQGTASFDWQNIPSVIHGQEGKFHITQKPIALPTLHISASAKQGAIVFDPFAGSGTTGVACQNLGRKARMIEISPAYCAVILERFLRAFEIKGEKIE